MPIDVVTVIVDDHSELDTILAQLESGAGSPAHRRDMVEHLTADVVRHCAAEEQYVYPSLRDTRSDGDSLAELALHEHAETERVMKDLEKTDSTSHGFEALVTELIAAVRHHVRNDEDRLVPYLRDSFTEAQLEELGDLVLGAKDAAPTRPHPSTPDASWARRLLNRGIGLVDRVRDILTGRVT